MRFAVAFGASSLSLSFSTNSPPQTGHCSKGLIFTDSRWAASLCILHTNIHHPFYFVKSGAGMVQNWLTLAASPNLPGPHPPLSLLSPWPAARGEGGIEEGFCGGRRSRPPQNPDFSPFPRPPSKASARHAARPPPRRRPRRRSRRGRRAFGPRASGRGEGAERWGEGQAEF